MTEDSLEDAAETLATLAHIESLQYGIAAFKLSDYGGGLEGPKWYEAEDWLSRCYIDHVAVPVPVDYDDEGMLLERCRLELRHGLERLAFELAHMRRFDPDRSKFPDSSIPRLLGKAERCLAAIGEPSVDRAEQAAA